MIKDRLQRLENSQLTLKQLLRIQRYFLITRLNNIISNDRLEEFLFITHCFSNPGSVKLFLQYTFRYKYGYINLPNIISNTTTIASNINVIENNTSDTPFQFMEKVECLNERTYFKPKPAPKYFFYYWKLIAKRRAILISIAVKEYQQHHGRYPSGLEQLLPAISETIILDPFTQKPFEYASYNKGHKATFISSGVEMEKEILSISERKYGEMVYNFPH